MGDMLQKEERMSLKLPCGGPYLKIKEDVLMQPTSSRVEETYIDDDSP